MLEEISIQNLGVIKEAKLPFGPGLTVITGETGAGKTMVLSSLGLLMGKRSDAHLVRSGTPFASVEGCWRLSTPDLLEAVEATGAVVEDGELFINRTVREDGKSRAVIGGKTTPTKVLADVSTRLVSIHGQADQLRLKSPEAQLEALDSYGSKSLGTALQAYKRAYKAWRQATRELKTLQENEDASRFEYQALLAFREEWEALDPQEGELDSLAGEIDRLAHLDTIREGVAEAMTILAPEDYECEPAEAQLRSARSALGKLASYDSELEPVVTAVEEALAALDTAISSLESYSSSLDEDGLERLYQAQERERELKAFTRKQRRTLEELFEKEATVAARLEELDPETHSVEVLQEQVQETAAALALASEKLTKLRTTAAKKLAAAVNEELAGLAMGGSSLVVVVEAAAPGPLGADAVAFSLTMPGASSPRPISKAASGGELSRIMLALEVVLASPDETPTFVFDEVDSGVGGATAIEIGRRLAKLAQEAQVIVVTHLPQVACWSDTHLKVTKEVKKGETTTTVAKLSPTETVEELTRMLSGLSTSEAGQAHAVELLELAAEGKRA